jgi:chaperonin GroES
LKAIDGGKKVANPSGIWPTEFKVLVKPKTLEERVGSIIIPESTRERDQYAQMEGTLVAVSPLAFNYADDGAIAFVPPKVGDHVLFAKYAGADVTGKDGETYRVVNDRDIAAVIT